MNLEILKPHSPESLASILVQFCDHFSSLSHLNLNAGDLECQSLDKIVIKEQKTKPSKLWQSSSVGYGRRN
jgi:hypothetical protein